MKKILLSFSIFLFLACSINAQMSVRAGLNLANLSFSDGEESESYSNSLGIHLGLTYEKQLNEKLSFRPGLLFSMKGAKQSFEFFGEKFESKFKINYLEVPLDFSYAAGALDINAGPYVGYAMSAQATADGVSEDIPFEEGGLKRLDFGLNIGLAYNINEMLSVGGQYGLGLANLGDNAEGDDSSVKNNVIAFFAAYSF